MVGADDGVGFEHECMSGFTQLPIDNTAHAKIGVDECAGSRPGKQELLLLQQGTPKDGPVEAVPGLAAVAELETLPDILVGLAEVVVIHGFGKRLDHGLDIAVELAAADESDVELFHGGEEVLVEKAGVHADDDRDGLTVTGANHAHHMLDHLRGGVAVVRVLVAATEHGVDDVALPGHLERLEALDLLVGGLDAMSLGRLVVVHDHGVNVQLDHSRAGDHKPPEEKLQKQASKKGGPLRGKGSIEPFDGVRGGHVLQAGFDGGCVARVLVQDIEVGQVTTCAVKEEAENLLEQFVDGRPWSVCAWSRRGDRCAGRGQCLAGSERRG